MTIRNVSMFMFIAMILSVVPAFAASNDFYPVYQPEKVIGHVPLPGSSVQQMFLQAQGQKEYLYVQQAKQQGFEVVDVSKPKRPKIVTRAPERSIVTLGSGLAITEPSTALVSNQTAALSGEATRGIGSVPEQVRVLDVSNPQHPKTVQTFNGVTSILPDNAHGLVYLANAQGIWILSHQQYLRRHMCGSEDDISVEPNCD
jgi:hypothetical protein